MELLQLAIVSCYFWSGSSSYLSSGHVIFFNIDVHALSVPLMTLRSFWILKIEVAEIGRILTGKCVHEGESSYMDIYISIGLSFIRDSLLDSA